MKKLPFSVLIVLVAVPCAISKSQSQDETGMYIFHQELSNDISRTTTTQSIMNAEDVLKDIEMFRLAMVKDVDLFENMEKNVVENMKSPVNIYHTENYDHNNNEDILREAHPYRMLRKRKKIYFPFIYHKGDAKPTDKRNQKSKLICFNCQKDIAESLSKGVTSEPQAYVSENLFSYADNDKATIPNEREIKQLQEFNYMSSTRQNVFLASEPNLYDSANENNGNIEETVHKERSQEQDLEIEKKPDYPPDSEDEFKKRDDNLLKNVFKGYKDTSKALVKIRADRQYTTYTPDIRGEQRLKELEAVQKRISAFEYPKDFISKTSASEQPNIFYPGTLFN